MSKYVYILLEQYRISDYDVIVAAYDSLEEAKKRKKYLEKLHRGYYTYEIQEQELLTKFDDEVEEDE